eukprot:8777840-Pyramimonas_sp.AAC.1
MRCPTLPRVSLPLSLSLAPSLFPRLVAATTTTTTAKPNSSLMGPRRPDTARAPEDRTKRGHKPNHVFYHHA